MTQSNIIMYTTEDGVIKIEVTFDHDTVWLSIDQMAELFQRDKSVIGKHVRNIFKEGELAKEAVWAKFAYTASDGKTYQVDFYNLDVIISVGYRVKSLRGTQFRIWAASILKEYMKKGFALDDDRLKNLGGGNYFDELLARPELHSIWAWELSWAFSIGGKMKRLLAALICVAVLMTGCSEADKVNANISQQADYFECERKITVYNARTDMIILEAEGYMSISNNNSGELVCTVKTGPSQYKKNYIYLNDYTMYVVEDITGTHTDPYQYKMYFHTEIPVSVETKP